MYAPQCHPGPRCSNCSAPLWSHCELRSYRVQGQELMERQLGQHFRGNWDKCWTSPGFRLSAWHRWSSSPLAFIACIFTLQSPPPFLPRLPQVRGFLICYLSCIIWLRRCWIQLPRLVLQVLKRYRQGSFVYLCAVFACFLFVSVGFHTAECLDIFYIYISWFWMLLFCPHQKCVSAVYVSLEHVSLPLYHVDTHQLVLIWPIFSALFKEISRCFMLQL